jgi:hypothetical protein
MKKDEVRSFMFSLLGKNERIMVSKRFAAILLLRKGVAVSEVSRRLKLTQQTINRLQLTNELKGAGFNLAIKKVNQDKIAKEINILLKGLAKGSAEILLTHRVKLSNDYPRRNKDV